MKRIRPGGWIVWPLLGLLVFMPVYQLSGLLHAKESRQDAAHLLYQVSLFQMELFNSYLQDPAALQDTSRLNVLKQAAYSASYAHEKLVMAMGEDQLTSLRSLPRLMQYILRLQIGGNRPLKPEEIGTLREAGEYSRQMYDVYSHLLSSGDAVYSSQNNELKKLDREMDELLGKKLLQ